MNLIIPKAEAIALLNKRLSDLNSSDYDPVVWKDRTRHDVKAIFPLGDTHWLGISQLTLDTYLTSDKERVKSEGKVTARRQVESIIDFIEEHSSIISAAAAQKEETFEEKYKKILDEWNEFVPKYNQMLHEHEAYLEDINKINREEKNRTLSKDSIKILFLGANPSDQTILRVDREIKEIDAGLKRANERDIFHLNQKWAVSPHDIQQAILDDTPDIVHFSGHGDTSGIVVEDSSGGTKLVSGEALADLFSSFADEIRCVVLNSCFSLAQAEEISKHITYVIGMSQGVNDNAAIHFAVGFYAALGAGKDIEFAFKMGVVNVKLEGLPGSDIPKLLIKDA